MRAYLRSTVLEWLVGAFIGALVAFVLAAAGVGAPVICVVLAIMLIGVATVVFARYARRKEFYGELADCADDPDRALWMAEMVDRPGFWEGEVVYDALRAISKSANDGVAASRRQLKDYREYVETWVHEAKSPLAAAHLMLENLRQSACGLGDGASRDGAPELASPALRDKLDALDDEMDRVEGYIEQALFFARSETLDRDYLIRPHSLRALVTSAIKANARTMIASHVAPACGDLDFDVFTDDKWMEFILGQLIQNSVKYASDGGGTISFSARRLEEGLANERVELTVSDDGRGVSEAEVPRVFDRGFTGENGRSGKRSTGIGLYLVARLCDKMGLRVSASSGKGMGFAVTIGFPCNKMHYFE